MESSTDGKYRIIVRRKIPAPCQVVYDAWIDPQGIKEWMCPGDILSAEATLDVRVGGTFRIVMKGPDRIHQHTGTYQVVDPPSKLVFTWFAVDNPSSVTLVTVQLFPQGEECELVLIHERFSDANLAERYENGWGTIARKLAVFLSCRNPTAGKV